MRPRRRGFLASVATAVASCAAATAFAAPDDFEPNDSQASATNVRSGEEYTASIDRLDDAQAGVAADVDWYRLRVGVGAVDVAYKALQSEGGCFGPEARLLDAQGKLLGSAQPAKGKTEHIKYQATADAPLFLRVAPYQIDACQPKTDYGFTVDFSSPVPDDDDPDNPDNNDPDKSVENPKLEAKAVQRQRGPRIVVKLSAGAGERVDVEASGRAKAGGKRLMLTPATGTAGAGATTALKLKARGKPAKAIKGALKKGKKVKVKVAVTLTDSAGNKATDGLSVQLR